MRIRHSPPRPRRGPGEALAAVVALRRLADELEVAAVDAAHHDTWSFAEIGEALGVSKQAVHKKHGKRLRGVDGRHHG
jgi:DNA-directed RNA polymerase specialized sigma24 family protein